MRLKSFFAPTMAEIMDAVRSELGDTAIIVSSHEDSDGLRVMAALEREPVDLPAGEAPGTNISQEHLLLRRRLDYHGIPAALSAKLLASTAAIDMDSADLALAAALDDMFRFSPLPVSYHDQPLMLVGPHGSGKSVTIAKLAARAALKGSAVSVISTDTQRAGATAQLAALTEILGIGLLTADSPETLATIAASEQSAGDGRSVLIDTAGANPYDTAEMQTLKLQRDGLGAESVVVLPAAMDPAEAADTAAGFKLAGARRLLVTRVDATHRYGSILAAAEKNGLALGDVGTTPRIGNGLQSLNPMSLARLILRDPRSDLSPQSLQAILT